MERRLALSTRGAYNFVQAIVWTAVQNLTFMFPIALVYLFIGSLFEGTLKSQFWYFLGLSILFIIMMYFVAKRQYDGTYTAVYDESAIMRIRLAEKLRKLPLSFFGRHNASDLTNRIMGDVDFLENAYSHQLPQMVASFLVVILAGLGLACLDWRLALALFWAAPVVLMVLTATLAWQKRCFEEASLVQLSVSEKVEEGLTQYQTIKAYGAEMRYQRELEDVLGKLEHNQLKTELSSGVVVNGLRSVMQLAIPTLVIVGSNLYLRGEIALDTFLFFLLISVSIYTPLTTLMTNALIILYSSIRINRMNEIYNMKGQDGTEDFTPTSYDITFKDVSFAYSDGEKVLHNVGFTAKQGEVTALIGPSGGGKSTCAKLASRFWDAQSGSITLGGKDIREVEPETLLTHYAIVFQDVVLFNNSILENIRLGRKEASDEEVLDAARLAQCDDFVSKLPQGYDTIIGENGSFLSGGERQRISIARAILKDAPIIILDEATSSQDAENETQIQRALSRLTANKTVLIIAHRMRTIRNASHIVVLSQGQVVEQGTPAELYNNASGYYKAACDIQAGIK